MKKTTINHYLNKRVKPTIIYNNITAYPLYLQIITQRKTQQIKSFLNVYMSEKAFEIMRNGGSREEYMRETNVMQTGNYWIDEEPKILKSAIEFLITNDIDYNLKSKYFKQYIEEYTQTAYKVFSKETAKIEIGDLKLDDFTNCLNIGDKTLIYIQKAIENTTNTDIFKYLPTDYIKIWQVVELIKYAAPKINCISFLENDPFKMLFQTFDNKEVKEICGTTKTQLQKKEIEKIFTMLLKRVKCSISVLFY